jgi:DICT domain-containing protein
VAIASLLLAGAASANRECISVCKEEARDCAFDARESLEMCSETYGCDVLREEYRDTCFAWDRDREACSEARQAYRECITPCKEQVRDDTETCRSEVESCLVNECQVDDRFQRFLEKLRDHHQERR